MPLTFPLKLALQSLRALGKYFHSHVSDGKIEEEGAYLKPW